MHRTDTQPSTIATVMSKCLWCACGVNTCGAIRQRRDIGGSRISHQMLTLLRFTSGSLVRCSRAICDALAGQRWLNLL
jgi:hypothetical protein